MYYEYMLYIVMLYVTPKTSFDLFSGCSSLQYCDEFLYI